MRVQSAPIWAAPNNWVTYCQHKNLLAKNFLLCSLMFGHLQSTTQSKPHKRILKPFELQGSPSAWLVNTHTQCLMKSSVCIVTFILIFFHWTSLIRPFVDICSLQLVHRILSLLVSGHFGGSWRLLGRLLVAFWSWRLLCSMIFFLSHSWLCLGVLSPGFLLCIPLDGSQLASRICWFFIVFIFSHSSSATEFFKATGVRCG